MLPSSLLLLLLLLLLVLVEANAYWFPGKQEDTFEFGKLDVEDVDEQDEDEEENEELGGVSDIFDEVAA